MVFSQELARLLGILVKDKGDRLYAYAYSQLGQKKSGTRASVEYGCAEAVNRIFSECFGTEVGGDVSTMRMYQALLSSPRFLQIKSPTLYKRGDIIISPTGLGSGRVPNGHVGILGEDFSIMSNDSKTGLWDTKISFYDWVKRYVIAGGYPMCAFRVIF